MAVIRTPDRPQGWLSAAAVYGLVGVLMNRAVATPLGWAGILVGMIPTLLIPRCTLPPRWEKAVTLLRCLWAIPVMTVSLEWCVRGITEYSYPGWWVVIPAGLTLLLAWRGSWLDHVRLERLGKLLSFLLGGIAVVLLGFTLPQMRWGEFDAITWQSAKDAVWIALMTAGVAGALTPADGFAPGVVSACLGSGTVAVTTGAEGAALAGMLTYPFLTLCDAAAMSMRLSSMGAVFWMIGETALLVRLLSWLPDLRWLKALVCLGTFLLRFTLPWSDGVYLVVLIGGSVLGYLPPLCSAIHRRMTGRDYI